MTPTFDTSTFTDGNIIPESIGSFDTSNLTGGSIIPDLGSGLNLDLLPEGELNLTPKKKFNIPKINSSNEDSNDELFTISFDELDGEEEIDFFNQGDQ